MVKSGQVIIEHPDWCKSCCICVEVCPTHVLALIDEEITIVNADKCIACGNCELSCPDFVFKVVAENE